MSLSQFLGNLGTVIGGQAGGMIPGMGNDTLDTPFAMQQMQPQQQQKQPGGGLLSFFGRPGTKDAMGQIGDYLLQANDMAPIYGPRKAQREQERVGSLLGQYLGQGDEVLSQIMSADPQTGMALLKMKADMQKGNDPTALMQNMEYLRRLNPTLTDEQLADVAQYAIAAPRMYGSPETGFSPDPNYPFVRGQQAPQAQGGAQAGAQDGQTATNPQTGEKIVFRNGAWVPAGGASGNAGGGFP